jgi:hypothetical protein
VCRQDLASLGSYEDRRWPDDDPDCDGTDKRERVEEVKVAFTCAERPVIALSKLDDPVDASDLV